MRRARVSVLGVFAGILEEEADGRCRFIYDAAYNGPPVSLTLPLKNRTYTFDEFPVWFEGLLPEGVMLEALLRKFKLDKKDYFGQLLKVGRDLVGAVTFEESE